MLNLNKCSVGINEETKKLKVIYIGINNEAVKVWDKDTGFIKRFESFDDDKGGDINGKKSLCWN